MKNFSFTCLTSKGTMGWRAELIKANTADLALPQLLQCCELRACLPTLQSEKRVPGMWREKRNKAANNTHVQSELRTAQETSL